MLTNQDKAHLCKLIANTAMVIGQDLPANAVAMMVDDMSEHSVADIEQALKAVRQTSGKRINYAIEVLNKKREASDGRPSADEAFAMLPRDDSTTCVMTAEMGEAWGMVRHLIEDGQDTAARMAFRDAYSRLVAEARERGELPAWTVSIGTCRTSSVRPIADAVRKNRITLDMAQGWLGAEQIQQLLQQCGGVALLPDKDGINQLQSELSGLIKTLK